MDLRGSITIGGRVFLGTEFEKLDSMLRKTVRFPSSMDNMYTWPWVRDHQFFTITKIVFPNVWKKAAVAPLLKEIAQPKHVSSGRKMKTNQFSTFITHDTVNNESNRLASCTVPDHVSSFREPSVSVCAEGTVDILKLKHNSWMFSRFGVLAFTFPPR